MFSILYNLTRTYKATPNKFPVSRPDLKHFCLQADGPFSIISL